MKVTFNRGVLFFSTEKDFHSIVRIGKRGSEFRLVSSSDVIGTVTLMPEVSLSFLCEVLMPSLNAAAPISRPSFLTSAVNDPPIFQPESLDYLEDTQFLQEREQCESLQGEFAYL